MRQLAQTADPIYSEIFGDGDDVLMIHGWGMHLGIWREFARATAVSGYRVTLIDLPGHGRSNMIDDYSLDSLSELLATIAPARCHLVGWSLGGMIALRMSQQSPDRFLTLTMIASNLKFCGDSEWPGSDPQVMSAFVADVLKDHHRTLLRFFGLQTWGMEDAKEQIRQLKGLLEECEEPNEHALAAGLDILRTADLRSDLQTLRIPLLVLLGAKDRLVPIALAAAVRKLSPSCGVHVFSSSAHIPFITEKDGCLRVLLRFWSESSLSGPS